MRDFNMAIVLLHVFKSLQMQSQDHGQFLHSHSLLGLLIATAIVAFELVIAAQCLRVAKTPQTVGDRRVLVHVHLQVKEVLILTAHRLAVQTSRFTGQDSLKYYQK